MVEAFSQLYVNKVQTDLDGVAFFEGKKETEGERGDAHVDRIDHRGQGSARAA